MCRWGTGMLCKGLYLSTISTHIGLIPDSIHPAAMVPVTLHHRQVEPAFASRLANRTDHVLELLYDCTLLWYRPPMPIERVGIQVHQPVGICFPIDLEMIAEMVVRLPLPERDLIGHRLESLAVFMVPLPIGQAVFSP